MLPEDAIKLEDGDPLLVRRANLAAQRLLRRRASS